MKKILVKAGVLFAVLTLCVSMTPSALATEYENIIEWNFDGNDEYSSSWTRGGYTTTGITPDITIEGGKLKVEEDYTSVTSTYNNITAVYSFGASSQADLSEAEQIMFDYYCSKETPNNFLAVFTGTLSGASSTSTKTETVDFDFEKSSECDIEGYDKYEVTMTLSDNTAEQRKYVTRFQLGENRRNNAYRGTVYYDNIRFCKTNDEWQPVEPEGTKIDSDSTTTDIPAFTGAYSIPENISDIREGGRFKVVHSNPDAAVVLALSGTGENHNWVNVSQKTTSVNEAGYQVCEYTYDAIKKAWGTDDFSDYKSVRAQTWGGATTVISVEWIPASESGKVFPAQPINDNNAFEDGSRGWLAKISGNQGETLVISNPRWAVTNSENKTAVIQNAAAGDITVSTEGTVVLGLVLTKTAIGENDIEKVEFQID